GRADTTNVAGAAGASIDQTSGTGSGAPASSFGQGRVCRAVAVSAARGTTTVFDGAAGRGGGGGAPSGRDAQSAGSQATAPEPPGCTGSPAACTWALTRMERRSPVVFSVRLP